MPKILRRLLAPLVSRSTFRRWAYLILGGALSSPFVIGGGIIGPLFNHQVAGVPLAVVAILFAIFGLPGAVGLIPAVRTLEGTAARELLDRSLPEQVTEPARSWSTRCRTAGWFSAHVISGAVVSTLTLAVPPIAFFLLVDPFTGGIHFGSTEPITLEVGAWGPPAGVAMMVGLVYLVAAVGAVLARLAPFLLGPSAAERLAKLELRAEQLAERNRLARELHDSVGHSLSIVTVQASAASRVMDSDPEFARGALRAIEESARGALEDLDHVLGLLREEATPTTPQPTLAELDGLLHTTRLAGVELHSAVEGAIDEVPPAVSREAYRIVQEGLTNAVRHAGRVPVTLRVAVHPEDLELQMTNPLGDAPGDETGNTARRPGGRGLRGIRERVTVLRGDMTAAADGGQWRLAVRLPLRGHPDKAVAR